MDKSMSQRGRLGGRARAAKMSPEERARSARIAAWTRWHRGEEEFTFDREALTNVCRKWDIKKVEVFGSCARGDMRPDSDVDVIVTADIPHFHIFRFMELQEDLEGAFKRPVDLHTRDEVRRWRNPYLKACVKPDVRSIYASR